MKGFWNFKLVKASLLKHISFFFTRRVKITLFHAQDGLEEREEKNSSQASSNTLILPHAYSQSQLMHTKEQEGRLDNIHDSSTTHLPKFYNMGVEKHLNRESINDVFGQNSTLNIHTYTVKVREKKDTGRFYWKI